MDFSANICWSWFKCSCDDGFLGCLLLLPGLVFLPAFDSFSWSARSHPGKQHPKEPKLMFVFTQTSPQAATSGVKSIDSEDGAKESAAPCMMSCTSLVTANREAALLFRQDLSDGHLTSLSVEWQLYFKSQTHKYREMLILIISWHGNISSIPTRPPALNFFVVKSLTFVVCSWL